MAQTNAVITDVVYAYRAARRSTRERTIAEDALGRATQLHALNEALVESGRLAANDLLQSQTDKASQELALAQAKAGEAVSFGALQAIIGKTLLTPVLEAGPEMLDAGSVPDRPTALSIALHRQPEYRQIALAVQQANLLLDVARNSSYPDVSVYATNSTTSADLQARSRATTFGLLWNVPLNDRAVVRPETQARAALEQAEIAERQSILQMGLDVDAQLATIELLKQQVNLSGLGLDLSRRKFASELEKFKAGRSSNFQLLSFQDDLKAAELAALDTTIEYSNALTALDRLLGTTFETWGAIVGG